MAWSLIARPPDCFMASEIIESAPSGSRPPGAAPISARIGRPLRQHFPRPLSSGAPGSVPREAGVSPPVPRTFGPRRARPFGMIPQRRSERATGRKQHAAVRETVAARYRPTRQYRGERLPWLPCSPNSRRAGLSATTASALAGAPASPCLCHERARLRRPTLTTPIREKRSCARHRRDDSFIARAATARRLLLRTPADSKEKSDVIAEVSRRAAGLAGRRSSTHGVRVDTVASGPA